MTDTDRILILAICVLINIGMLVWNFKVKNYKTAIICGFSAGFCLMSLLYIL